MTVNSCGDSDAVDGAQKKGCRWLYVTHGEADSQEMVRDQDRFERI